MKRLPRFDFLAPPTRLRLPWATLALLVAALAALLWQD
jgi:hypothetical protein